jgi:hypothetical protein
MHTLQISALRTHAIALTAAVCLVPLAQTAAAETITATARAKNAAGVEITAPVSVVITKYSSDAERDALLAAVKSGGTESARKVLEKRAKIGSVKVGSSEVAVQHAYARNVGDGRLITVVTNSPIVFIGAGKPGAKPTAGFDLGLLILEVNKSGPGKGELVPAAKVKANADGAIVTDDYAGEVVQLSNVIAK